MYILLLLFFNIYGQTTHSTLKDSLPKDCGRTRFNETYNDKYEYRILVGKVAARSQFPWVARVGTKYGSGYTFFHCGGALISTDFVISAAGCKEFGNIVRLGQSHLMEGPLCNKFNICTVSYQDIKIKRYIFEDYCVKSKHNDLQLIELDAPAELNTFVQPICLHHFETPKRDEHNQYIITAGWGYENKTARKVLIEKLVYFVAPIQIPKRCQEVYKSFQIYKQFCLETFEEMDICQGEPGSPGFIFDNSDGVKRAYLIGIVSYSEENSLFYPVYTSVEYFLDNIVNKVNAKINATF